MEQADHLTSQDSVCVQGIPGPRKPCLFSEFYGRCPIREGPYYIGQLGVGVQIERFPLDFMKTLLQKQQKYPLPPPNLKISLHYWQSKRARGGLAPFSTSPKLQTNNKNKSRKLFCCEQNATEIFSECRKWHFTQHELLTISQQNMPHTPLLLPLPPDKSALPTLISLGLCRNGCFLPLASVTSRKPIVPKLLSKLETGQ